MTGSREEEEWRCEPGLWRKLTHLEGLAEGWILRLMEKRFIARVSVLSAVGSLWSSLLKCLCYDTSKTEMWPTRASPRCLYGTLSPRAPLARAINNGDRSHFAFCPGESKMRASTAVGKFKGPISYPCSDLFFSLHTPVEQPHTITCPKKLHISSKQYI